MSFEEMAEVIKERFLPKLSPAFAYVYDLEKRLKTIKRILEKTSLDTQPSNQFRINELESAIQRALEILEGETGEK